MQLPLCRGLAVAGLLVALLTLPSLTPRVEAAPDPGQRGPYAVGFTSFVLTDTSRPGDGKFHGRPIPVYVWYPVDPESITASTPKAVYPLDPLYRAKMLSTSSDWEKYGIDAAYQEPPPSAHRPFPLVMVSPGWGAPAWVHMSVGTRLASHGFVVAVLYHFGDGLSWWEPFHHIALACWNRPRDMSFALTDLLAKNTAAGSLFQGLISPDQVAAAGWSLGGFAAMDLAGGDDGICNEPDFANDEFGMGPPPPETCTPTSPDPRIKAIVPLDGSSWVLKFQELARINVPALCIGQEWNELASIPEPWGTQTCMRAHAAISGQPNYRVDVFNSSHGSFSDWCEATLVLRDLGIWPESYVSWRLDNLCNPYTPTTETHRLVGQYMVSFLKTQLLGQPDYQSILTPGWALTSEPLIEFFTTEKRNANATDEEWPDYFFFFLHQSGSEQARGPKDPTHKGPIPWSLEDGSQSIPE